MARKTCIIYDSWGVIIRNLETEKAGEIAKGICGYVFADELPSFEDPSLSAIFSMMKQKLDEDGIAYQEKVERAKENRKKYLLNKKGLDIDTTSTRSHDEVNMKSSRSHDEVSSVSVSDSVSDNVSVSDTVSVSDKDNNNIVRYRAFTPPTLAEVQDYCRERGNKVDPQHFIDFYESKGWMIGKNKMKNWKASVRTWERSENERKEKKTSVLDEWAAAGMEVMNGRTGNN